MIHTELFMEGVQLDITQDIEALFTYAVDDVRGDLGARNTSYSKTIKLPGTGRNNAIFGQAFEFAAFNPYNASAPNIGANFNAAKAARALVFINSIQVFKGVIRLLEVVQQDGALEYECAVFGELGGLITAIGNKLLTDLDFSAYNASWNAATITGSWPAIPTGSGGSGVYWPLIDYGDVSTDKVNYQYQAFRPALYVKEYLEKIFAGTGYTYDCALSSTAYFKRLVIPHNEDNIYVFTKQLVYASHLSPTQHFLRKNIFSSTALTDLFDRDVDFPGSVLRSTVTIGAGNTQFTYSGPAASVYLNWRIKLSDLGNTGFITFKIRINGADWRTDQRNIPVDCPGGVFLWYWFNQGPTVTLNSGDVVSLHFSLTGVGSVTGPIDITLNFANFWLYTTAAQAVLANYGETIEINHCIPKNVLQADLLSSVVKMHNLYVVEDKLKEKHVVITPYPDLFDNSDPLDWSAKVDRSREIRLKPMSEVNARYFNFLYEKDSDYYNDLYQRRQGASYGDFSFDTGLDFVTQKKDLKLIFAPSPLVGYPGLDKYVTTIFARDSGGVESRIGSKIRILQGGRFSCTSWHILEGATVRSSPTVYGYAGHVDDPINPAGADLNWGAPAEVFWTPGNYAAPGLFAAFWSAYMAEITDKDSKLLACYVHLTPVDIYTLDFARSILIDGQLWRLNRVVDYDPETETVTKAELLKVINLSY